MFGKKKLYREIDEEEKHLNRFKAKGIIKKGAEKEYSSITESFGRDRTKKSRKPKKINIRRRMELERRSGLRQLGF